MTEDGSGKVFTGDGRPLTLEKTIKSGGAGSIHRIVELPDLVAKIYHPNAERGTYERKVEAMIKLVPDLPDIAEGAVREVQITWPRFELRDGQRRFVGFAMPLLDFATSIELECVLQERQARAQGLPTGLGAKVTLAANLASLIAEVHRQGHYVIDLKPVNLRFYRRSLHIAMLDCDGFSIKGAGERFPATQFTPEYLAPEFQKYGLAGGDQASNEEAQDRFALAVVIFQLLNFGIHPFTGRPSSERVPTDIPGRIAHHCYAYGVRRNPDMAPNPASGHMAMPVDLRLLFDRAFGAVGMARPSADDWVSRMRAYGRRSTGLLVPCRTNPHHQHFAGLPCAACARASLLNRASSVVRPQARAIPVRTAPHPAPSAYVVRWQGAPVQLPQPPPAGWSQQSTPSFAPKSGSSMGCLIGLVVAFLAPLIPTWCSSSHHHRDTTRYATETTHDEPTQEHEPATSQPRPTLDGVLSAARGSEEQVLDLELRRLPSSLSGPHKEECQTAFDSWDEKLRWTDGDFESQRMSDLPPLPLGQGACEDLHSIVPSIVRTQELCKQRLDSPGAYEGIAEAECRDHDVIEAGTDTLRRTIIYGNGKDPLVWFGLAEAFLLVDERDDAQAAFTTSAFLYRNSGLNENSTFTTVLREGWLRKREEILMAFAWAQLHQWNGEFVSEKLIAKANAPWPKQPPPKKPRHRRADE